MSDRLSTENDRQYLGYGAYRDLGPFRTLIAAYVDYWTRTRQKAGKRGVPPNKVSANFSQWKAKFQWDERVRAWDLAQENRERDLQIQADSEAYLIDLQQFRDCQLRLGRSSVLAAIEIKERLLLFIENFGEIETLDDAETFAKIAKLLENGGEVWGRGLAINELLDNLQNGSQ